MAAQSQLIRNRDTQKSCFSGSFLLKIASHGQTVHFRLYSVIHNRKALVISFHMVFFKNFNVDPARRQIFGNALAEKCIPVLRVRLMIESWDPWPLALVSAFSLMCEVEFK